VFSAIFLIALEGRHMTFGEYLKQLREEANMRQTVLADKLDIWVSHIGNLEKGRANPPPKERIEQIAAALSLTSEQKDKLSDLAFNERNKKELDAFKKPSSVDASLVSVDTENLISVPVFLKCPASVKSWVSGEIDRYEKISKTFTQGRRMFIMKIHGDSMDRAGIDDGCMVLVDSEKELRNGNIVVARVDDECTIKRYYKTDHKVTLSPDSTNPEHQPMVFTKANKIIIHGVVDSIYLKKVK